LPLLRQLPVHLLPPGVRDFRSLVRREAADAPEVVIALRVPVPAPPVPEGVPVDLDLHRASLADKTQLPAGFQVESRGLELVPDRAIPADQVFERHLRELVIEALALCGR
jgi:hypothetical protein